MEFSFLSFTMACTENANQGLRLGMKRVIAAWKEANPLSHPAIRRVVQLNCLMGQGKQAHLQIFPMLLDEAL